MTTLPNHAFVADDPALCRFCGLHASHATHVPPVATLRPRSVSVSLRLRVMDLAQGARWLGEWIIPLPPIVRQAIIAHGDMGYPSAIVLELLPDTAEPGAAPVGWPPNLAPHPFRSAEGIGASPGWCICGYRRGDVPHDAVAQATPEAT